MGGWKYRYEPEEIDMEKIAKSIEWELNSRYERVYREFKDCNITEEFQAELKAVLAAGLKAKRVDSINRYNAEKEEAVKILNKHGITLENFEDVRKEVKAIEVTDTDLRTVLQSIMKTMRRDCPEGKIVIFP
jgi:copper homeostasis protein CutC